jgi:glycosyltransferase involved in cell wall biosynthesis
VLTVGSLQPRKNLPVLFRGWQQLQSFAADIDLVVVGSARGNFAPLSDDSSANHVRYLGYVEDAQLPALYAGALCVVIPSEYEGFGLPVLEAMACGAPVIAASGSALEEVAGDAAMLVDARDPAALADALETLLLDSELRKILGARGRAHAARYTWEQTACETWNVLESAAHD